MDKDPDQAARQRLNAKIADAHDKLRACQERAMRKAQQLAEARGAMAQSIDQLQAAQEALDRLSASPWVQVQRND